MSFLRRRIFYTEISQCFDEHSAFANKRIRTASERIVNASRNSTDKAAKLSSSSCDIEYRCMALCLNNKQPPRKAGKKSVPQNFRGLQG